MKTKIYILIIIASIFGQNRATVSGFAFLENETNHSGIEVMFEPISESAVSTSIYTDSTGIFIGVI